MLSAKEKCERRLSRLERSLSSLEEASKAYRAAPEKQIYIMALAKSFELSFELCWKALKDFLEHKGSAQLKFARDVIKLAFRQAVIKDGQLWINMLEDRNRLSHIYDEALARQMAEKISKSYVEEIASLTRLLKKEALAF